MPILCYELTGKTKPNELSTTGALDGQVRAVLKDDHAEATAQLYSELAANRLAVLLGVPVLTGVPAIYDRAPGKLFFAALKAAERTLDLYDFTKDGHGDINEVLSPPADGIHTGAGHEAKTKELCERYERQAGELAAFDIWIGNNDRPMNFKATLQPGKPGVMFALDQGSSLLSCGATVEESLRRLASSSFPRMHPFQKLVRGHFWGGMVERIRAIPDWAVENALVYDDNVGVVTMADMAAAAETLLARRKFLSELCERILG